MNVSKLKMAVENSRLTKKDIASQSGISPQALSAILDHSADPKVSTLEAIAKVVGVKMSVLFDEINVEVKDNERSFNSNADGVFRDLTSIIKSQEDHIRQLTDKLLGI